MEEILHQWIGGFGLTIQGGAGFLPSTVSLVRILAFSGAVSSSPNAIALIGSNGRYLTADQARGASDGAIHVTMDQYL